MEVAFDGSGRWLGAARFQPLPEHRGNEGWLHGGLAATVLDHVLARTGSAALGQRVVTGRLDLRFRRPVLLSGGPFLVRAAAETARSRTVRVSGAILGPDETPLVEASALFVAFVPQR